MVIMGIIIVTMKKKTKKPSNIQWELIKTLLLARGYSLADLARLYGVNPACFRYVKKIPYPKIEKIIASYLGVKPQDIWPERYDENGKPNRINQWYLRGSRKVQDTTIAEEQKSKNTKKTTEADGQ